MTPACSQPPALFALVQQFNLAPATYVDASWLPRDWLPQFERLRGAMHTRTAQALSRWLLTQHALADEFDFDFGAKDKRLALLDGPAFQKLARYLGLAVHARSLRGVVQRAARNVLMQRIGADAYEFLLRSAPVIDAGAGAQRIDPAAADLEVKLLETGSRCLLEALPDSAHAAKRRAQLKLPRSASSNAGASEPQAAVTRRLLISHFIPAVLPQWAWLF
jgi:hypothetical protein